MIMMKVCFSANLWAELTLCHAELRLDNVIILTSAISK